ncbi:structural protein [Yersinia phage vB_Yru_GN1]|uniref:Structural protein n=1 Tax=Yersinia phage vB_Yru_GN1 TaxID=3074381 RepID=A0AA86J0Q7_9CAUD|nr:structural protein [Yersinia phage vB_Yru_GN1]
MTLASVSFDDLIDCNDSNDKYSNNKFDNLVRLNNQLPLKYSKSATEAALKGTFNNLCKRYKYVFDSEDIKESYYQNLKDVLNYNISVHENDNEIVLVLTFGANRLKTYDEAVREKEETVPQYNPFKEYNYKYDSPRVGYHFNKHTGLFSFLIENDYDPVTDVPVFSSVDVMVIINVLNQSYGNFKLFYGYDGFTHNRINYKFTDSYRKHKLNFMYGLMKSNMYANCLPFMNKDALFIGRSTMDRSLELHNLIVSAHPYTVQFIKKYKFCITSEGHIGEHRYEQILQVDSLIKSGIKVNDDKFLSIILDKGSKVKFPKYIKKYLSFLPSRFRLFRSDILELISDKIGFYISSMNSDYDIQFSKPELLPRTRKEIQFLKLMKYVVRRSSYDNFINITPIDNIKLFTKKHFGKYKDDIKENFLNDYYNFLNKLLKCRNRGVDDPDNSMIITRSFSSVIRCSIYYHENINRISLLTNQLLTDRLGVSSSEWYEVIPSYVTRSGVSVTNITTESGLKMEGMQMSHCVGGYTHSCITGKSFVFSLREVDNEKSRSTLEIRLGSNKKYYVNQNYTYNNRNPSQKLIDAGNEIANKMNKMFPSADHQYELSNKYITDDQFYKVHDRNLLPEEVDQVLREFRGLIDA